MKDSKEILVLPERCMGCGLCEWVCCLALAGHQDDAIPEVKEPGIGLRTSCGATSPLLCRHCDQAPCLEACIAGALRRDPVSGLIIHDPDQ